MPKYWPDFNFGDFVFFSVHTQVGYYYFIGFGEVFADQGSVYIIKYL